MKKVDYIIVSNKMSSEDLKKLKILHPKIAFVKDPSNVLDPITFLLVSKGKPIDWSLPEYNIRYEFY